MRFLVDENLSSPRLASRLRAQGHDPVLATDVRSSKGGTGRVLPVTDSSRRWPRGSITTYEPMPD